MDKDLDKKFKLGIFVVAGTVFFIFGIYFIGKDQNIFKNTFVLTTSFSNIQGLRPGNEVRFLGINVGTVKEVAISNDSTIVVEMVIAEKSRTFIKQDAIATLGTDGLMGDKIINIIPGKAGKATVKEHDYIPSYNPVKTEDLLKTLEKSNKNILIITNELVTMMDRMMSGKSVVGMLLSDTVLSFQLSSAIRDLRQSSHNAEQITGSLNSIMANLRNGEGAIGKVLSDTAFAGDLSTTLTNLEKASEQTSQLTADLNKMILQINQGEGAAGTLVADPDFASDLKKTMASLKDGTEGFNQNMEALKHNIFFRRYFRKKEKEKEQIKIDKSQVFKQ